MGKVSESLAGRAGFTLENLVLADLLAWRETDAVHPIVAVIGQVR